MAIGSLLPWVAAQWFTDAGDAVLSGGRVYFYAAGTTTPKTVYQDYQRLAAHAQPVVLSSSGHATIFLGDGGYKVVLTDESGAVMDTKDGIFGGSGNFVGLGSNATVGFFKLYADVRALTDGPDVVYVSGRAAEGDGGQGLFQLLPGSSIPDDDGVYLVAGGGSFVYKRIFDVAINPEWYGVKYGVSSDQSVRLGAAVAASINLKFPVLGASEIYLTQSMTIPSGASLMTNDDGYFRSPSSITMAFAAGSKFSSTGTPFHASVQPTFAAGTVDEIRLSWMAGGDLIKLIASAGSVNHSVVIDQDADTVSSVSFPANIALDFANRAKITASGLMNLSILNLVYRGIGQIIQYATGSYVGAVSLGGIPAKPEWFGAVGNGVIDDSVAFNAAAKTAIVELNDDHAYVLGPLWSTTPTPIHIRGGGEIWLGTGKSLGSGYLYLDRCKVLKADAGNWFSGTYLGAIDATLPATYTATTQSVVGCKTAGSALFPTFKGAPYIENAHLDLLSKPLLGTDATGKIIDAGTSFVNLTLGSLVLTKLNLDRGIVHSRTDPVRGDDYVLTHPMPLVIMFDNITGGGGANITLPDMTDRITQPNIVLIFPLSTGYQYNVYTHSGNGGFPYESHPTYMTTARAALLYYDWDTPGWFTLIAQ